MTLGASKEIPLRVNMKRENNFDETVRKMTNNQREVV